MALVARSSLTYKRVADPIGSDKWESRIVHIDLVAVDDSMFPAYPEAFKASLQNTPSP